MRLSQGLISEFQKRYFNAFGEHLAPQAAESELLDLAELVRITLPIKIKESEDD